MSLKKNLAKILLVLVIGASVVLPVAAFAAQTQNGGNAAYTSPSLWPTGFWGPIVWCTGSFIASPNPTNPTPGTSNQTPPTCTNLCDFVGTFVNIIYLALSIAIFIIAPLSIVVGGIMIMVAGANPEMLGHGKNVLKSAVVGLVLVLCSYLVVNTVIKIFNITSIGGFNGNASACSINQ